MRVLLTVEYDGWGYKGWQSQQNTSPTIQQTIERAIEQVVCHSVIVFASGRTDACVHARGQTLHFDTTSTIAPDKLVSAVNHFLPPDIKVLRARVVADDFHARYSVVSKTYEYHIRVGEPSVFERNYVHAVPAAPDVESMRRALPALLGRHDFRGFMSGGSSVKGTVREIFDAGLRVDGSLIVFSVCASGFLYNMVRIIVQALLKIGFGQLDEGAIERVLQSGERSLIKGLAPPQGLYLVEVRYND